MSAHALDFTHFWQYFRAHATSFPVPDTIRAVTGHDPQTLGNYFRANTKAFGRASVEPNNRGQYLKFQ